MSSAVRNRYCVQVSPNTFWPCRRARRITSTPSAVDTWKIITGWSRKSAKQMSRLIASTSPMRGWLTRVKLGRPIAAGEQALSHPGDHAVVLGMDADQGAVLARRHQHVEQLLVVEPDLVVGHEHLQRPVTFADELRQRGERGWSRIGDDHVEGVVDDRALRASA